MVLPEYFQLINRSLPVESTDKLLSSLALWGIESLGARAAAFWILTDQQTCQLQCLVNEENATLQESEVFHIDIEDFKAEIIVDHLAHKFSTLEKSDFELKPFKNAASELGGMLLWDISENMKSHASDKYILETLSLLIEQGRILERKNRDADLSLAAKMESMAEFAAGAGHEINNPLATISGRVQQLLRSESNNDNRKILKTIGGQAYRIRDMIGDAMLFGRPPEPELELIDLSQTVEETITSCRDMIEDSGLNVQLELVGDVSVMADSVQMKIVISQLLKNAMQASQPGQKIIIKTAATKEQDLPAGLIQITDWGSGFTAHETDHLFDPFFSGRQAGRGLGFGLSKCWQIVIRHHGIIRLDLSQKNSTVFQVFLPVDENSPLCTVSS